MEHTTAPKIHPDEFKQLVADEIGLNSTKPFTLTCLGDTRYRVDFSVGKHHACAAVPDLGVEQVTYTAGCFLGCIHKWSKEEEEITTSQRSSNMAIGDLLKRYGFHEHLLTEKEKAEEAAREKRMFVVRLGSVETVIDGASMARLDQELTMSNRYPIVREATEEEIRLHNEWLAQQKD